MRQVRAVPGQGRVLRSEDEVHLGGVGNELTTACVLASTAAAATTQSISVCATLLSRMSGVAQCLRHSLSNVWG